MARLICRGRSLIRSLPVVLSHGMCTSTSKSLLPNCFSPFLMLPPEFDDDTSSLGYNFYSLADKKVLTLPQTSTKLKDLMPKPIHNLEFCGSSHGWIAMFNPSTHGLFIYNPISLRHINLPPIHNLPNYPDGNRSFVKKLILSCSPDEQNCRVLIIYGCVSGVAFCSLQSSEWTPIGNTFLMGEDLHLDEDLYVGGLGPPRLGKSYHDFVHSTRQNLFFGLNSDLQLETWDLSDPSSPVLLFDRDEMKCSSTRSHKLYGWVDYLVVVDQLFEDEKDHVLWVTRYVGENVVLDGACVDYSVPLCPRMTVDFAINVYDPEKDDFTGLDSLGDLAIFIGTSSDSFALSVTQYPEVKSNSIYFTDTYMETTESRYKDYIFGGHDIGIFDFENKTVSPCYYPCDRPNLKRIAPSPIWFFPA